MLYRKTNENIALLTELKSFCVALILVSSIFYVGLCSLNFNHNIYTCIADVQTDVYNEFIPQLEICEDVIVFNDNFENIQRPSTINTETPFIRLSKSNNRLTKEMKSKVPVTSIKPPTGLSSSFKKQAKPVKEIKTPVTNIPKEAVLGVSKPYTLNKSLSTTYNPLKFFYNNVIVNSSQHNSEIIDIHDHIPTDQTKSLVASNEIELKNLHLDEFNSGIEFLVKRIEEVI